MDLPLRLSSSAVARWTAVGLSVMVGLVLAGCGASASPQVKAAAYYAQQANLTKLDLPAGWTSQPPVSSSASSASNLTAAQTKAVHALITSLPADCQSLSSTFVASLENAPPVGSVAQNQAQFSSASDGNAIISSTVAVFATLARSQATYALYAAPTFPACLQTFLRQVLVQVSGLTVHAVTVTPVPTPVPVTGVQALALEVSQSASKTGSQTDVSTATEVVMQSGRAMAFVEEESNSTALPADTQTNFDTSVSTVAKRLVPPPA